MGKLILIRHGEVTWNKQACYTGWTDLPLTEKGVEQARSVAERLKAEPLAAVYCSDLQRARATAEVIAEPHGLTPISNPDLRELNYGEWEGVAEADLPVRFPEMYAAWVANPADVAVPGGESFSQLCYRASLAVEKIMSAHAESTVAIVGHKSVNRVLLCHWLGVSINIYKRIGQDNAAINIVMFNSTGAQVEVTNDICYLPKQLVTGGD